MALTLASGAEHVAPKRILILYSFGRDFSPFNAVASALRTELVRDPMQPLAFYEASLDAARPGPPEDDAALVDFLRARFDDRMPDLVIPIGPPAARFALRNHARLYPTAPLLLSAADERALHGTVLGGRDSAVATRVDLPGLIENILRLLPETRTIAVILGDSPLERFWVGETRKAFARFAGRVEFVWLNDLSLGDMRQRVAALPANSAVLYGLLIVDAKGVQHEHKAALATLHTAASAPIFGIFEDQLGQGIVGGPILSQQRIGRLTAEMARRTLRGETVAAQVVPMETPTYDWRQLQRWNIDARRLPEGSIVRFQPPSLWAQHRMAILLALTILVVQAALIAGLLLQRHRRRRAEHEARALSGRLLTAHEDERRRLARELHDDLTQRLARLAIDAAAVERAARAGSSDAAARNMREDLVRLSEDVHALSYRLHPSVLDDLGLVEALRAECDRVSRREAVRVALEAQHLSHKLPPEAALCLFRVAQEALRNVARHAGARMAEVTLAPRDGGLRLAVRDDGIGFNPERSRDRPSLGHASMRERVRLVGGELKIDSAPGRGTTVVAWVPLPGGSA